MSKKATILYIEDDRASQRLVQRILEAHDYEVMLAGDGLSGIALARQKQPHLILMDINLPDMDGQEITTRLRSIPHFANTPIVALTANINLGSREQALAAGCTGFLTKPIDVGRFPHQVESFLQGRIEPLSDDERSQHLELYARRLVERLENKIHELQSVNQKLRELDRMKSDFIVLVSHELRTPLTLISGYSYLLQEKAERADTEAIAQIAEGLGLGVQRLSQVVNEIINVSRVGSGTLDLAIGPLRLVQIVRQIVKEISPICRDRKLNLTIKDLNELPIIEGDGTQLKIAISNVVNNAIKFTPDGGCITITGQVMGDAVDLIVQDTGVGIAVEDQRRIFEQFQVLGSIRHHSTSKSAFQGGGLGLGLAIAKGIIEAHNGRIWVESEGYDPEKSSGSTFHILLSIRQMEP